MNLKNYGNHLVFSEKVLGRLKKTNLISKSLQGYFHSFISSHTLKIWLHQERRTANCMEGFLVGLSNWRCGILSELTSCLRGVGSWWSSSKGVDGNIGFFYESPPWSRYYHTLGPCQLEVMFTSRYPPSLLCCYSDSILDLLLHKWV